MRLWVGLVAVLALACSQQAPQPRSIASTPSVAHSTAPASPSPNLLGLNCRLPVEVIQTAGNPPGGWITFPGGNFQPDPSSIVDRGNETDGISYDRAVSRWIPAFWNRLSPDGRRYVFPAGDALHVVDVRSGKDRVFTLPRGNGPWSVIDFTTSGVYLKASGGLGPGEPGLWVLDSDTGQVRKLDGTIYTWSQVDSRAAWAVTYDAGTIHLRRLDLRSGALTTQLTVPFHELGQPGDQWLDLIGLDEQGRPLVSLAEWQKPSSWRIAVVEGPEMLRQVALPSEWANRAVGRDPYYRANIKGVLLTHGIWMIGHGFGLALYSPDGEIRQLTASPEVFAIAGGCH